jgi:hypothetical protein
MRGATVARDADLSGRVMQKRNQCLAEGISEDTIIRAARAIEHGFDQACELLVAVAVLKIVDARYRRSTYGAGLHFDNRA